MYLGMGITCLDVLNDALRIPLGKRRLGGDSDICRLLCRECECIDIGLGFDEASMSWYLSHDALWFRVSLLANVENIIALRHKVTHKIVCARYIRAGSIDTVQSTLMRTLFDEG